MLSLIHLENIYRVHKWAGCDPGHLENREDTRGSELKVLTF